MAQQPEVLRTAVARGSTNTAAAAGTAILKTLSGGGPSKRAVFLAELLDRP